jgi:FkbM family methyltransferase
MTSAVLQSFRKRVKHRLIEISRSIPIFRRVVIALVKKRAITIPSGAGEGLRFNIAGQNIGYAAGTNEMPVQMALVQCIRPGDVFYDIGANIGFFTVIAARLVGPGGRVYAFEPVPQNVSALRRNIRLNQFEQVQVMECAVSNHSGEGELLLANWGGGSALATASTPPDQIGKITVALASIDQLLADEKIAPPAIVKIDVEGAELQVLEGMHQAIQAHRPLILYELDDEDLEAFQRKQVRCEEYLYSLGYKITRLEDSYPGSGWVVGNFLAEPLK